MESIIIELQTPPGSEAEITKIIRTAAPNPEAIDIKTLNIVKLRESLSDYIPPTLAVVMQVVGWGVDSKTVWDSIKAYISTLYVGHKKPPLPSNPHFSRKQKKVAFSLI
ncbi:MAG: hypothetical protein A3K25_10410 [Planctomycetes bacterium RIFOXYB12_FULL_42_10]|nr:MAG: hypothetical protein A3K25_10410 [Planctomycetes bacterium RIFOXYB12_FULL_42_10]